MVERHDAHKIEFIDQIKMQSWIDCCEGTLDGVSSPLCNLLYVDGEWVDMYRESDIDDILESLKRNPRPAIHHYTYYNYSVIDIICDEVRLSMTYEYAAKQLTMNSCSISLCMHKDITDTFNLACVFLGESDDTLHYRLVPEELFKIMKSS